MASNLIKYTVFQDVFFPTIENKKFDSKVNDELQLRKYMRYQAHPNSRIEDLIFTVFDFETTGLNARYDRIIEIGAQKIKNFQVIDEYSTLIQVDQKLNETVQKLTGISNKMLEGQNKIEFALKDFFEFMKGTVLIAHNANSDIAFLKAESMRLGIDIDWSAFCSLKLSRKLLPDLESKSLDSLAKHYNLHFEARHRSIGDVKVTVEVLNKLFSSEGIHLKTWSDLDDFKVE